MKFDIEEFKLRRKTDFEGAWHAGPSVITPPASAGIYPRYTYRRANVHPIFDTIARLRTSYLSMGFDEVMVPVFIDEQDVYHQFGPEAAAVLDRVYYVGGLPRPNVGISSERFDKIAAIIGTPVSEIVGEKLMKCLHGYKKGKFDGDDLIHEMSVVLGVDDGVVVRILDMVFPEFKKLAPESSRTTLRSHMTSGWFLSLAQMWDKRPLPIRMFSIDRCFRREQEEDATHLRTYHSASCIIAGEDVTFDDGKAVVDCLLSAFGFVKFRFKLDEKRSKYYMPETQTEVYGMHPIHGWVEVATFGLYSPAALAEYGVGVPVMNLGMGVERLAMILTETEDVRKLSFSQLYPPVYSDLELAKAIGLREEPQTIPGRRATLAIVATATSHANDLSPCEFLAWTGDLFGKTVVISVVESEENSRLLGPAALNEIFVRNGAIFGVPDNGMFADIRAEGVPTGISFLYAAANLAMAKIEEATLLGKGISVQVKMSKHPSDVNLKIEEYAMRYVTDNKKKIDLRGPVFLTIISKIL
ncbi:MAG: O-phosphoserine--tRNA ligase [Methanocalculaceae archaeon]|jgi:O-phosphoseryl-tRNA synthetase|nr:O-phosphoserine--tRNA ligase [Methanocalculaceae archaeon]